MDNSDQEALDIHAELLEISNNSSQSRFMKKKTPTESKSGLGVPVAKEGETESAQKFLEEIPENGNFNQYWYSLHTIETICRCITQVFESRSNTTSRRVAFLSTPSIYFALPEEERVHCTLFDVRFCQFF
jgi:hypothetical protein